MEKEENEGRGGGGGTESRGGKGGKGAREREYRGEEKEEGRWALGVGCLATGETRPRYSEISLYCFRSGSHISPARLTRFFRVGRSNAEKWLTDRTDDHQVLGCP